MRIQALCIAVLLIVAAVFCGCKVKENPAETDVYSRPLFNDASDKASEVSGTEIDISVKSSEPTSSSDNNTDSDTESMSETSSENNVSTGTSSVTRVTQEITTYYYYYETEETDTTTDTEVVSTVTDSTDSEENDDVTDSDSETSETDSETAQTDSENSDIVSGFSESDLDFVIGDTRIKLGDIISDYEDVLGEPIHVTDVKNADGEVIGKTYDYQDFSINTTPDEKNENDIIASIEIFSDNISTEKGLKTGMGIDMVTSVYGSEWMLYEDEYRYYVGNSYIYFYVQNGIVANIGYNIDKDMEN